MRLFNCLALINLFLFVFSVNAADKVKAKIKALTLKVGDEVIYKKQLEDKEGDLKTEHVGTIKKFFSGGQVLVTRKPCVIHPADKLDVMVMRNDIASIKPGTCFKSICIGAAVTTSMGPSKVVGIFENGVYIIEENGELPGYLHKNAPFWKASYDRLMFPLNVEKSVGSTKRESNSKEDNVKKSNEKNSENSSKSTQF
ncbi:MAG: hypothetical protein U0T83_02930 [Bacteriovoracaceae bacterium]